MPSDGQEGTSKALPTNTGIQTPRKAYTPKNQAKKQSQKRTRMDNENPNTNPETRILNEQINLLADKLAHRTNQLDTAKKLIETLATQLNPRHHKYPNRNACAWCLQHWPCNNETAWVAYHSWNQQPR